MTDVTTAKQRASRAPELHRMISDLEGIVAGLRNHEDAKKLRQTADLLREIRNQATHHATPLDFGKISARLALDLLFAILDFCEVVFVAFDPGLAPLCTTAENLAEAIDAVGATKTPLTAETTTTPTATLSSGTVVTLVNPNALSVSDNAKVYAYLVAHNAKTVKTK